MADQDDAELASKHPEELARHPFGGGRLGTYTILGAASGIVPLPWVPDAMVRRIRGALVHDLASRHSLSLTPEARAVLVEPGGPNGTRGLLSQGVTFVTTKMLGRMGPLAMIPPARSALGTFVLGYLFARYLETARSARSIRVEVEEARRIRRAIDQALLYAFTTEAHPSREGGAFAPDDMRDRTTQIIDGVLISIAGAPNWLVRRLEAAFDEALPSVHA
ncbi:MAG: hypothetical protein FWD69_01875 [Polyangiaceae bacterium]|nr:hypothetical protein [Polyangiaceae bacterium]